MRISDWGSDVCSSDLDQRSSMIFVPLFDHDPVTNARLDYRKLDAGIEDLRARYQAHGVRIHVIGFAKLVGDLVAGLMQVLSYFVFAALIAAAVIYAYTRCLRSTLLVVVCSLIAEIGRAHV